MRVGIIGAGAMGRAMARRAALAGALVLLADPVVDRTREPGAPADRPGGAGPVGTAAAGPAGEVPDGTAAAAGRTRTTVAGPAAPVTCGTPTGTVPARAPVRRGAAVVGDRARRVAREAGAGTVGSVVATTATAAFQPDFVILALSRQDSMCFLQSRVAAPDGKTLVDVTAPPGRSPLDRRMRDLVAAYPQGTWVRACAAGDAESIYRGDIDGQPVDVFVASDDETAKVRMIELTNRSGLRALDAGGLDRARLLDEMVRLGSEISHQLAAVEGWGLKFLPSW